MEQLIPYIPAGLVVAGLIAINIKLKERPTFKDITTKDMCDEKHKTIDEKLERMDKAIWTITDTTQRIEVKLGQIEVFIKNNGKK